MCHYAMRTLIPSDCQNGAGASARRIPRDAVRRQCPALAGMKALPAESVLATRRALWRPVLWAVRSGASYTSCASFGSLVTEPGERKHSDGLRGKWGFLFRSELTFGLAESPLFAKTVLSTNNSSADTRQLEPGAGGQQGAALRGFSLLSSCASGRQLPG